MSIKGLILLLSILGCACTAQAEWQKLNSGTLAWLHAVQFLDADTGFVAGSNGTLLATNDGGRLWRKLPLPVTDTIRDVHFVDRSNAWMLCDRGKHGSGRNASYLLRTVDGGLTWSSVDFKDSPERFSRLFFATNGAGYLIGEGGMMAGLPGGEKAEPRTLLPVRFLMVDGTVIDEVRTTSRERVGSSSLDSKIFVVGGGGSLIASDNGGKSWHAAKFADARPDSKLNAIFFFDRQNGWVAGNGGLVFSTADGGGLWGQQVSNTDADLFDIAFYDRETGFAVGDSGTILRTENSGEKWSLEKSGSKHRLERLAFAGKRAIAVGFGGTILSTDLP
jgi:photosystem II stability/assembly factor-like uncharacterized protein